MKIVEQEVIRLIKLGDERSFGYIFENHYKTLCLIAFQFLKEKYLAETIVSDVIFNLWKKRGDLEIQTSLRAYLVQAVRYSCLNYLQQNYVIKEMRLDSADDMLQNEVYQKDSGSSPLGLLLEKELEQEIRRSVDDLQDECRLVFTMSRYENLKYEEIAEKLNMSVDSVKYYMKKALSKMRADLSKYLIELILLLKALSGFQNDLF